MTSQSLVEFFFLSIIKFNHIILSNSNLTVGHGPNAIKIFVVYLKRAFTSMGFSIPESQSFIFGSADQGTILHKGHRHYLIRVPGIDL